MKSTSYAHVFKELIALDLVTFKQTFADKIINLAIWVVLVIVVMGYIMPFFGLSADYGVFQLGGIIAATGMFELYSNAVGLVADFEGDRVIDYYLTLPVPSWITLAAKATYYFITYVILALAVCPLGKFCLWHQLDITTISYGKLLLAIGFQSIFYACFVLWAASIIHNMRSLGNIWSRYIFPMWFMGGFQFSWQALYKAIPVMAYVVLLNPMIYITESVRSAITGPAGYINFGLCLAAIAGFAVICFVVGFRNLKQRLDFV